MVRSFFAPGGKLEKDETAPQALIRELKEEFTIDVREINLRFFGSFTAEAANHPGQQVHMEVFIVQDWQGDIHPSSEVKEILWLTSEIQANLPVGSIFKHEVIPRLKKQGLIK